MFWPFRINQNPVVQTPQILKGFSVTSSHIILDSKFVLEEFWEELDKVQSCESSYKLDNHFDKKIHIRVYADIVFFHHRGTIIDFRK